MKNSRGKFLGGVTGVIKKILILKKGKRMRRAIRSFALALERQARRYSKRGRGDREMSMPSEVGRGKENVPNLSCET